MRRRLIRSLAAALALPVLVAPPSGAARAPADRMVSHVDWDTAAELAAGRARGTALTGDSLTLTPTAPTRRVDGRRMRRGTWTSPWTSPGFPATELIASWQAATPGRSFVLVEVRGRAEDGVRSSWDTLARWASSDRRVRRTTFGAQSDDLGSVATDTWRTPAGVTAWQLRVTLLRPARSRAAVRLDRVGAVASRLPAPAPPVSTPTLVGTTLAVPSYSQMTHRGHFPQWGGGGQAWCSPTSTSMVLGYYGALPAATSYARYVPAGHPDPYVDHAARMTYDYGYDGTGNWPFNTAYAAGQSGPSGPLTAFVTRLRDLTEAETLIAAGIPVVASISFRAGQLSGAPIGASAGHLLVIVGFTAEGDVVVNDPAAPTNAGVRRTYDRAQLERAWLGGSGGVAYVVHDAAHPLPASPGTW